jgi:hypothetical protein
MDQEGFGEWWNSEWVRVNRCRHCEPRSGEAIQNYATVFSGLLRRFAARNDAVR